jgi:hypothetical protein
MVAGSEDAEALERDPQRQSTTPARKDFAMEANLVQLLGSRRTRRQTESRTDLVTCSLCLRVLRGSEWIDAEHVIREIRSYELEAPPRLHSGVCEFCAESIFSRRAQVRERFAA